MAFNKYQWELYLKSNGKETVQHFQDFLDGKFEGYPEFIKKLVSGYCPDPDLVLYIYNSVLDAIDKIKEICSGPDAEVMMSLKNNTIDKKEIATFADYSFDPYASEWVETIKSIDNRRQRLDAFYKFIPEMIYTTQLKAFFMPNIYFPYYFQELFIVLNSVADMFDIELPPIPGKTQQLERIEYYCSLCKTFYEFANNHNLSCAELWAFLYDYGPSCVGGAEWISEEIPEPRNIFVFGYGPVYPEKVQDNKWICQGSPDMQIGDIGLLYHWAPDKCYTSIWRAISPGYYDPLATHDRNVCYGKPIEIPHITYNELRNDPVFKDTSLVQQNMIRMDGAPMLPSEYMHLLEMAKKKGPIPENVPLFELKTNISSTELLVERDVEEQLLEPFLLRLGWKPENWCRQMPVRIGRGISKYPDYVIHPVYTKNHERGEIVLEAKLSIPNNKQLEVDRGQAHSYAKLLTANAYVLVAKEGIWIATKDDDFESIAGYLWKELEDTDTFSKISKIIGNQQKNKQKRKNSTTGD